MNQDITAHFYGSDDSSKQAIKSITVQNESKSLTISLQNFQKEVNTYLTECIEKNAVTSVEGILYN